MIGEYLLGAVFLLFLYLSITSKLYAAPAVKLLLDTHERELADKDAQIEAWKQMALQVTGLAETSVELGAEVVKKRRHPNAT